MAAGGASDVRRTGRRKKQAYEKRGKVEEGKYTKEEWMVRQGEEEKEMDSDSSVE